MLPERTLPGAMNNVYLFSKRPKCDARRLDRVRMAIPQMSNKGLARQILATIFFSC